eukprot:EG_transcript_21932
MSRQRMAPPETWPSREEFDEFLQISDVAKEMPASLVERWWQRLQDNAEARRRARRERKSPVAPLKQHSADLDKLIAEYTVQEEWWQAHSRVEKRRRSSMGSRASTVGSDPSVDPLPAPKPVVNATSVEDIDTQDPAAFVAGTVQVLGRHLDTCEEYHRLAAAMPGAINLCHKRLKAVLDEPQSHDSNFWPRPEGRGPK